MHMNQIKMNNWRKFMEGHASIGLTSLVDTNHNTFQQRNKIIYRYALVSHRIRTRKGRSTREENANREGKGNDRLVGSQSNFFSLLNRNISSAIKNWSLEAVIVVASDAFLFRSHQIIIRTFQTHTHTQHIEGEAYRSRGMRVIFCWL